MYVIKQLPGYYQDDGTDSGHQEVRAHLRRQNGERAQRRGLQAKKDTAFAIVDNRDGERIESGGNNQHPDIGGHVEIERAMPTQEGIGLIAINGAEDEQ